ncbi:MAG: hypothetical protein GJ677_08270 [Rhodobacteraceae bacterium]|nr:hypothetical protein [Paracoccaceae bacterium]
MRADFVRTVLTSPELTKNPVRGTFEFRCAAIAGQLTLDNLNISVSVWIDDSALPNGADLYQSKVDGSFTFDGSFFGDIGINANSIIARDRFGLDDATLKWVTLGQAQLGYFSAKRSEISSKLSAIGLKTTHWFNISEAILGNVSIRQAEIGAQFTGSQSDMRSLDAFGAAVTANFLLESTFIDERLYINDAKLGRNLALNDAWIGEN